MPRTDAAFGPAVVEQAQRGVEDLVLGQRPPRTADDAAWLVPDIGASYLP